MPVRVKFFEEGMGEDGGFDEAHEFYGVCLFNEADGEVFDREGRGVATVAKAVIDGDAAPGIGVIGGGIATVDTPNGERRFRVVRARRVRAASHNVRHTVLELAR